MKKNQIETGVRSLSLGLALAVFAVSLVLGACDVIESPKETAPLGELAENDPAYTVPDADGKVRVKIQVPADDARSLTGVTAKRYADFYEVIFKDRTEILPIYYSDSKPAGETLAVQIPVGHHYDILFLAGYDKSKRVLVGSSFINDKDANGVARYNPPSSTTGLGYLIEAGKVNVVEIGITPVTVNPNNAYVFSWDGTGPAIVPKPQISSDLNVLIETVGPVFTPAGVDSVTVAITAVKAQFDAVMAYIKTGAGSVKANLEDAKSKVSIDPDTAGKAPDIDLTAALNLLTNTGGLIDLADAAIGAIAVPGSVATANAAIALLSTSGSISDARTKTITAVTDLRAEIVDIQTAATAVAAVIKQANATITLATTAGNAASSTNSAAILAAAVAADTAAKAALDLLKVSAGNAVAKGNTVIEYTDTADSPATEDLVMKMLKKSDPLLTTDKPGLKLTVTLPTYLLPLIQAQGLATPATLGLHESLLTLATSPRSKRPFLKTPVAGTAPVVTGSNVEITYTIPYLELPDEDAYGIMTLNLGYYPFGTAEAGKLWNIRNGLDNLAIDNITSPPDENSSIVGGGIFVTIGKGGKQLSDSILVNTQ
jgi:hypothetical protein